MIKYTIKEETLQNIASSIRGVNGRSSSFKIKGGKFSEEIGKLAPPLPPIPKVLRMDTTLSAL